MKFYRVLTLMQACTGSRQLAGRVKI
ncbi:uncharacterized protein METZ01_LOCUS188966, partial [marine metagenome]